jgi:hypothetical protein
MLESKFKATQREYFEKLGWKFIQLDPGAGVPMGFPDTLCLSPTGYSCYVEWKKSRTAEKQPLQDYWNEKLNSMGHDAFFVNPSNVEEWRRAVIQKSRKLSQTTGQ